MSRSPEFPVSDWQNNPVQELKMKNSPLHFDMPFRPNYELYIALIWMFLEIFIWIMMLAEEGGESRNEYGMLQLMCLFMFSVWIFPGLRLFRRQQSLAGRSLEFVALPELKNILGKHNGAVWLGKGFEWGNHQAQLAYEINALDEGRLRAGKFLSFLKIFGLIKKQEDTMGVRWIHGLGDKESPVFQEIRHAEGHTLIVGTTGSGKTRMFDILISQAIARHEAVIIIDPKGDKEMCDNARRCCEALGEPERFVMFNPAFPEESIRLNPLANFSRATEIATRIASLMPDTGGASATFRAFSWQAVNNIVQGSVICGRRPTLADINHYLAGGTAQLVVEAVKSYAQEVDARFAEHFLSWEKRLFGASENKQAQLMVEFYRTEIAPISPSPDIEGLLSMFLHDAAHFSKMVSGLLPMMSMLTSGQLGPLLSPGCGNLDDARIIYDTRQLINNCKVAYIGLDSLTDSLVGSAIGSLILSDLTAVAGDRYNYGENLKPVNLFVDEAAETINDPMIAMLNKGRGAGFRLYVATQTFADFAARLGSREKATQVLGNINNIVALRVTDVETQNYITDKIPSTRIRVMARSASAGTAADEPFHHAGTTSETMSEEEQPLFPAPLLGKLPNLEYLANLSGGKIIKGRIPILTGKGSQQ